MTECLYLTSLHLLTMMTSITYSAAPNNLHKPNQDALLMKHCEQSSSLIIACFDGHGEFGHDVSWFCKRFIESELPLHPTFSTDLSGSIRAVTRALGDSPHHSALLCSPLISSPLLSSPLLSSPLLSSPLLSSPPAFLLLTIILYSE